MGAENVDVDMREEIREIVADIVEIDVEQISWTSHFWTELQADSLQVIEILAALERRFRITIEQTLLPEMHDVQSTYEIVMAARNAPRSDAS